MRTLDIQHRESEIMNGSSLYVNPSFCPRFDFGVNNKQVYEYRE